MTEFTPFSIGRFADGSDTFLGCIVDKRVHPVRDLADGRFGEDPTLRGLLDQWDASFGALAEALSTDQRPGTPLDGLRPLAPLPDPRQIFCCGANYAKHVKQMMLAANIHPGLAGLDDAGREAFAQAFVEEQARASDPYIFMKTISSLCGPEDAVTLPPFSQKIDWELELGVVFGRAAYGESEASAMSAVAGYMVVNDLTARDRVRRTDAGSIGADWVAGKGSPGFLPTGPFFVPAAFVKDPYDLAMTLRVNGRVRQQAKTGEMTFGIARQIAFLTTFARLLPGDILCTGTPDGNAVADGSFLRDGDVVEAEIAGLGRQRTEFRAHG